MLGLFASQERKTRASAASWLEMADKVWHFRRDRLTAAEAADLQRRREELRGRLRERADPGALKLAIDALEGSLRRSGGSIYPKTSLTENVEFFVVAAIVIFGIRTYFVQPFKIPTNSMWPTYYGMTAENHPPGAAAPGLAEQAFRFLAFGAIPKEVDAPRSGQVTALFFRNRHLAYTLRSSRTWLIFPTQVKEYTFYVDGVPAKVQVPKDFGETDFDAMVRETFFGPNPAAFEAYWQRLETAGGMEDTWLKPDENSGAVQVLSVPLGRVVRAGEPILRFDLMTGDQLFVDRISYNFVRPRVGSGLVFRTGNIPAIADSEGDEYYIKRLVGLPGDVMEIRSPVLYRNGRPIEGAEAFDLNARRVPPYTGYTSGDSVFGRYLNPGETLTVPPASFFALGDNSSNSSDGRVWGFVPRKDVAGRPLFIYYPFTRRWGPAH